MATRTWSSSSSTDMNDTANYSGSGAFLTTDDLVFNNTSVINATATANLSVKSVTIAGTYTGTWNDGGYTISQTSGTTSIASGGTVTLTGKWKVLNGASVISSTVSLNNFELSASATTSIGLNASTLTIVGTFTQSGNTAVSFNNGTLVIQGNLDGAGTGNIGNTGTAILNITGTAAQTFSQSAQMAFNGGINVNKSSGTVTFTSNQVWQSVVTLTSGTVDLNTKTYQSTSASTELIMAGGTFTGSTNSVSLKKLTINSGTFTSTSGTLTMSGDISQSGGTFTHSSGTVLLSGTTISIGVTNNLYNLTYTQSATGVYTQTSNLAVTGAFATTGSAAGATWDAAGYNLVVTGAMTLGNISGFGVVGFTFKNTGSGTISYGSISIGVATIVEYTATSGTRNLRDWSHSNLHINGSGGTFTLGANLVCTGYFKMTAGTFTQGGTYTVRIDGGFIPIGGTITRPFSFKVGSGGSTYYAPQNSDVLKDVGIGFQTGTFDEAARNTLTTEADVKNGTTWYNQNVLKTGTY